jgi:hypothetical protein
MAEREIRERDILVAPNEYAYVQDLTKGDIVLYVGPTKISLSNTERMIILDGGRFSPVRSDEVWFGVHKFAEATSSQYVVLENPPVDPTVRPVKGANSAVPLQIGRKIVVPGPAQFPLWPGQRAKVLDGHELFHDEYVLVRVYDQVEGMSAPIGSEFIVRGTDSSFYVPKSGLEVLHDGQSYVRKSIRLDKNSGLYLRVIADFVADGTDLIPAASYVAGQKIFLRDVEGHYFPNSFVETVGKVERIPIAEKEGIYIRNFDTGRISTVQGPRNYLPDPTVEEVAHRFLDDEIAELYGVEHHSPDRAVAIYVPPSTAVMVTGKSSREVVIGPQTIILDYDSSLEQLSLSTGKPKEDSLLLSTCLLQIEGNKVSDLVSVRTRDHVELEVLLSYRVSFVGDSQRWFSVKNYVGLLCDHLGSIIRAAARNASIERFHRESTEILRAAILGPRLEDGGRAGRSFEENGMWVYDVEVLDVRILDEDVKGLLIEAQRTAIVSEISRKGEELRLGDEQLRESVNRKIYQAQIETQLQAAELEGACRTMRLAQTGTEMEVEKMRIISRAQHQAEALQTAANVRLETASREAAIEREQISARSNAFREQMQALQPELIATLKTLGEQKFAGELSQNLSPLAILGGESVADVAGRLLESLPVGRGGISRLLGGGLASVDDEG